MKKKWIAACGFSAFFLSAGIALWMEKPALTQMASNMITTTANSKLNGTLGFSSLDISLTGQVVLAKPVIKDSQGRIVFEGEDVRIYVNPGKIVTALKQGEILRHWIQPTSMNRSFICGRIETDRGISRRF